MKITSLSTILLFISACIFSSCAPKSQNKELIIGDWKAIDWSIEDAPSNYTTENTGFHFDKNGTYLFLYDGTPEEGTYLVKGDRLYTTPYEQHEIMVMINKLTTDTLLFEMNRGGRKELLTLIKKN